MNLSPNMMGGVLALNESWIKTCPPASILPLQIREKKRKEIDERKKEKGRKKE